MVKRKPHYRRELFSLAGMRHVLQTCALFHFQVPGEKQEYWEALHSSVPTVFAAGLAKEGGLILVRQFRFGAEAYTYELPGGGISAGEDPLTAARREFLEETGYDSIVPFQKLTEGWLSPSFINTHFIIYFTFDCEKVREPQYGEVEKYTHISVLTKPIAQIAREIASGSRKYDPPVSQALVALIARRIIPPFAITPEL